MHGAVADDDEADGNVAHDARDEQDHVDDGHGQEHDQRDLRGETDEVVKGVATKRNQTLLLNLFSCISLCCYG